MAIRFGIPVRAALSLFLLSGLVACDDSGKSGGLADAYKDLRRTVSSAAERRSNGFKVCNMTSARVGVAVGYQSKAGWTTEGWWNLPAHTCETLLVGTLNSRYYYVHAIDYDRGGKWANKSVMCTDDKAFLIKGAKNCKKRGYKESGFFEVDTKNATSWTVRLTDASGEETGG